MLEVVSIMTLIMTVNGRESMWFLADRRLSSGLRPPKDDGCKMMFLETRDGVAILGYAGLGATALGTQPADWMSAVLQGRNLPLEQSLNVLAAAMEKQFPPHLIRMPIHSARAHNIIVTALLDDELRLYSIDMALAPDRKNYHFRFTRYVTDPTLARLRTPRIAVGGTGGLYLLGGKKKWTRNLLRLIGSHDRHQVSRQAVADHLAALNYQVHLGVTDNSVGPRCIVAWRYRKSGVYKGGGGHQFYTGKIRDTNSSSIPTIANGLDISAIADVLMQLTIKGMRPGDMRMNLDRDEINDALGNLPERPDEKLR